MSFYGTTVIRRSTGRNATIVRKTTTANGTYNAAVTEPARRTDKE
jgi:hypothetical protein